MSDRFVPRVRRLIHQELDALPVSRLVPPSEAPAPPERKPWVAPEHPIRVIDPHPEWRTKRHPQDERLGGAAIGSCCWLGGLIGLLVGGLIDATLDPHGWTLILFIVGSIIGAAVGYFLEPRAR